MGLPDNIKDIRSGHSKVGTQVVRYCVSSLRHLSLFQQHILPVIIFTTRWSYTTYLENIRYERHTTSASSTRLGLLLDTVDGNDTFLDTFYDTSLGNVVAAANLGVII